MNSELVSLLLKNRWRKYFIVFCLFTGIGLMFSVRHLFPVFLDLIAYEMRQKNEIVMQPELISVRADEVESPEFTYYFPLVSQKEEPPVQVTEKAPQSQVQVETLVENNFIPIDFEDGAAPITIVVDPKKSQNSIENPIKIKFLPGDHCIFGDGHACVSEFTFPEGNRIIFVSVHSGMGGEADALRDLFEGTGINQGLYNKNEVQHNLKTLKGSEIRVKQGDQKITSLALQGVARISPEYYLTYTALPAQEALDFAIRRLSLDPELFKQDLLIIETCGWRLPDELEVDGLKDTSNSVYLAFVQFVGD
ncbi:MAG TPA: hypothetical protein DCL08_07505 [Anaerolineaceae bacterium]|nr:MAG: hypothetical protein XE04_1456 [Marinimicrobia bacterium 46_43]HAF49068.1 hypothetical protein [Anaerolineaceae bacterium]